MIVRYALENKAFATYFVERYILHRISFFKSVKKITFQQQVTTKGYFLSFLVTINYTDWLRENFQSNTFKPGF